MQQSTPVISMVVATRNRASRLCALLKSINALTPPSVPFEIVVVDNGSSDHTPQILSEWAKISPERKGLRVEEPGKSRALNAGIRVARGELLAFLDDDVVVDAAYLLELWEYFATHDCAAAQGAVLGPPEGDSDPELRSLLERYRSCIVRIDFPPDVPYKKLRGANMAVRRAVFEKVGLFNEQLGPGASGFSEDDELADRILAAGGWIGCIRRARVIHEIDRSRLTEEYFRERHRLQGRSRFVYRSRGLISILPNLANAVFHYVLYGMLGNVHRQYRAKGRYFHYREMLRLRVKQWMRDPATKR
jgi:GT2 family glycosyltransferase